MGVQWSSGKDEPARISAFLSSVLRKYAGWCRRQGSTAQCNPALGVLAGVIALFVVCWIYRQAILDTLLVAGLAIGIAVFLGCAVALAVSTIRWQRANRAMRPAGPVVVAGEVEDEATDEDVRAISDEAEWLASGVELAWSPDGKTLMKREPKA